jgi:hypothetical protein
LGLGVGLTTLHRKKNKLVTKSLTEPRTWRNMDMRFGTRNIRSLYRMGSLMTVSRELFRYRLDVVGGQ